MLAETTGWSSFRSDGTGSHPHPATQRQYPGWVAGWGCGPVPVPTDRNMLQRRAVSQGERERLQPPRAGRGKRDRGEASARCRNVARNLGRPAAREPHPLRARHARHPPPRAQGAAHGARPSRITACTTGRGCGPRGLRASAQVKGTGQPSGAESHYSPGPAPPSRSPRRGSPSAPRAGRGSAARRNRHAVCRQRPCGQPAPGAAGQPPAPRRTSVGGGASRSTV